MASLCILLVLAFSLGAVRVSPDVFSHVSANGSASVLVVLSNGSSSVSEATVGSWARLPSPMRSASQFKLRQAVRPGIRDFHAVSSSSSGVLVSANVTADGLASLSSDPAVAGIYLDRAVHALDAASNAQIGADKVQSFVFNGQNLTGRNQTVCVVDTGIDFTHESLGGCVGFSRNLSPNESVSYSDDDLLSFSTGQMSFQTSVTDTSTTDRSYVHIISGRTGAFQGWQSIPYYFDGELVFFYSVPIAATDAYVITDNRTNGNATQGIVMMRDPLTGLFVPSLDPAANVTVTYAPPLSNFGLTNAYGVSLYTVKPLSNCTLPADGTDVGSAHLPTYGWTLQAPFTVTPKNPSTLGSGLDDFSANVTISASSLNASCSGGQVRLVFNHWYGQMVPGLGAPGVRYAVENNYLTYRPGPLNVSLRIFTPGISVGPTEPTGAHSIWIPEPQSANAAKQEALSLDVGFGDQSSPHLASANTSSDAGFSDSYTTARVLPLSAVGAGFATPRGTRLEQLDRTSAQVRYVLAQNESTVHSAHPYSPVQDSKYLIRKPGYASIRAHFDRLGLDNLFDYVYVESPNGTVVANYTGSLRNVWTPAVQGDTLIVHLVSEVIVEDYGFSVDRVSNATSAVQSSWLCPKVFPGMDFITQNEAGMDDQFHGTHVSGIAAGNGTITGVAPDANLVSAKVLDAGGGGTFSSVIAGIDWCSANRDALNISVITMSLGTFDTVPDFCDDDPTSAAISRAVNRGIFVSVASGNSYDSNGVSYPACAREATAVGAVDSADAVAEFSNAWNHSLVLAPGVDVLSSLPDNRYGRLSGTSMATPHVAGLAALMQDFAQRANGTKASPAYLGAVMAKTGVTVPDSRNGLSYPRIDAFAALKSMQSDFAPRNLTLVSFANGSLSGDTYTVVNVTFVDDNTTAASCVLTWDNGSPSNFSMAVSPGACAFNITGQPEGTAQGLVRITDAFGNAANLSFTRRFNVAPAQLAFNLTNESVLPRAGWSLYVSFFDRDADACMLELDGANASVRTNASSANASNGSVACLFSRTLSEGVHRARLSVNDSAGQVRSSGWLSFSVDLTPPQNVTFVPPTPVNHSFSASNTTLLNASFTEANPDTCSVSLDGAILPGKLTRTTSGGYCVFQSGPLSDGTHMFSLTVFDRVGLSNTTGVFDVQVKGSAPSGLSFVAPSPANGSASNNSHVTLNASFVEPTPGKCRLELDGVLYDLPIRIGASGSASCTFNATLPDASHNATIWVNDTLGHTTSTGRLSFITDTQAPSRPLLSAQGRPSGFAYLNWSAASDNVALDRYDVYRNGSKVASVPAGSLSYADRAVSSGFSYNYSVVALDRAGNANASLSASAFVNDTVPPQPVTNLSAANLPDGSVNVSWNASTLDAAGEPESNVTYWVYRSSNASVPTLSSISVGSGVSIVSVSPNATLVGNTTLSYFVDASILPSNTTVSYAVLSADLSSNVNASPSIANQLNQTTALTCTSAFSAFSTCSGGSQSRTRTCFGQIQTETQACSSGSSGGGGGSGGSSSSGSSSSSGGTSSSSTVSSPTSGGAAHGGGGGGSANSFVIESIPGTLEFSQTRPASTKLTVSSTYTGYLRYLNFTLEGIPRTWYDVIGPTVVTPISKTDFWISWHIPPDAKGQYPVRLILSGVGTKNAGLLKTTYPFVLVLSKDVPAAVAGSNTNPSGPGTPAFQPLQPVSGAAPFTGAVTAGSIDPSDAALVAIILPMGIGGYWWANGASRR